MVLNILEILGSRYFPTQYTIHVVVGIVLVFAVRSYSQGRATTRERNLHARTILVTGGFTPFGLTILQELAQRGAHIIALSPDPIDSPRISLIVDVLRTTTSNEQIYAEYCDLLSPASIQSFCKRFLSGEVKRLDAMLFTHEYPHIGALRRFMTKFKAEDNSEREQLSLASFLLTTLLLPSLLTAPTERDIRIINVVNRFYAAASSPSFASTFYDSLTSEKPPLLNSVFLAEGIRSLGTIILTRHLQRILDALPAVQIPKTDSHTSAIPVVNPGSQRSNIVAITVSPGISRADTVARILNADWTSATGYSWMGVILYLLVLPLLHLFTKSSVAAVQSVLHALFLPTPFKLLSQATQSQTKTRNDSLIDNSLTDLPEEVLKPGALYAECAVVRLTVPSPSLEEDTSEKRSKKHKGKGQAAGKNSETLDLPDDGELGGELAGRRVWEAFEEALKVWENTNPTLDELEAQAKAAAEKEAVYQPPKIPSSSS
ncbi:hypothetical protein J3R30DRAFT_1080303 [Lentinula aciculospora]|uniref:Ketoreductase (KR) domain-containing protein n=1 Tax=Lentinula aciculospora TaxID=153920 RepID=A0A9W9DHW6_9AGAR|nr:hypothetical protein J3R30DRAFT_1080303 [Lentinula aciculospora]